MKVIAFVLCVLSVTSLHIQQAHLSSELAPGKVTLQIGDAGSPYLTRCHKCGPAKFQDSAALFETDPTKPQAIWQLQKVRDQVAFKSDNGCYLSYCQNCWNSAVYPNQVFVQICDFHNNPESLWTPIKLQNGKWTFKNSNGRFLVRCEGCADGNYVNFAFAHYTYQTGGAFQQWTVNYVGPTVAALPTGPVNIQSDIGTYLARCNNCGEGAYPDSVGVHETDPNSSWAIWKIEKVGDKVAFKADTGNYLSRCNNCWSEAAYPDAAFVHVPDSTGPWAQWTPEDLGNGKWAFKADTGKYLARCNGCVADGAKQDFAFVHIDSSPLDHPYAQWTVTSR